MMLLPTLIKKAISRLAVKGVLQMAAYRESMVSVIKVGGRVLREHDGIVTIPFGSEYVIAMKNLEARRAVVDISIDGEKVNKNGKLVINPNEEVEFERFVEDLDKGQRFKFIQKTEKIQGHRGDKIDDGIVRIEFQYEKAVHNIWGGSWWHIPPYNMRIGSIVKTTVTTEGDPNVMRSYTTCSTAPHVPTQVGGSYVPVSDEGITVQGSDSNQRFHTVDVGPLDSQKHTIVLRLNGTSQGQVVSQPITTRTKIECSTCGTKNTSKHKFCTECGTRLI